MRATARLRLADGTAFRSEAHGGRAGEVHAAGLRCADPHSALVRHGLEQLTRMPRLLSDFSRPPSPDLRKLLAFGSGVGIEIGAARPGSGGGARARGAHPRAGPAGDPRIIASGRRPNGAREYAAFLKSLGVGLSQRHGAAAAARSDRAPGGAARRGGQGHGKRHPPATGHAASLWRRGDLLGLVAAGSRRRAGGDCAAKRRQTATWSCSTQRDRGCQLHFSGRGGARGHPAERPAGATGSWR